MEMIGIEIAELHLTFWPHISLLLGPNMFRIRELRVRHLEKTLSHRAHSGEMISEHHRHQHRIHYPGNLLAVFDCTEPLCGPSG